MASSEDNDSISTTDERNNNECVTKNKELRVRDVSELNGSVNGVNGGNSESVHNTTNKRKLPSWMISAHSSNTVEPAQNKTQSTADEENTQKRQAEESTQSKRCKTTDGISQEGVSGSDNNQNETNRIVDEVVKAESVDLSHVDNTNRTDEPESSDSPAGSASSSTPEDDTKVKSEPVENAPDDGEASTSTNCTVKDIKPAVKIEKADASSTSRESCKFGIRCYRRNAMHRIEEAHPGDHDYKRPSYPPPPDGTPNCPYGNSCYRRNPVHFQQYSHPADTDFERNYRRYRLRQRRRQQPQQQQDDNQSGSDLDDYDLDDPFINDDSDADYVPSDDGNDSDLDYDDCDKAEE